MRSVLLDTRFPASSSAPATAAIRGCPAFAFPDPVGRLRELVLPEPHQEFVPCDQLRPGGCAQAFGVDLRQIRSAASGSGQLRSSAPSDLAARVRYRWQAGHHASIATWRACTAQLRALADAAKSADPEPHSMAYAAQLIDLYTVLLLYAGSCTPDQYAATVRADMAAHDPAFSGLWARDHTPLLDLERQLCRAYPDSPLAAAIKTNRAVHAAVAARLVPDGRSLLQEAGHGAASEVDEACHRRYDTFFRIRRAAICERGFNAQWTRRLAQIACDLGVNGLDGAGAPPLELSRPHAEHVSGLTRDVCGLLLAVASPLAPVDPRRRSGAMR